MVYFHHIGFNVQLLLTVGAYLLAMPIISKLFVKTGQQLRYVIFFSMLGELVVFQTLMPLLFSSGVQLFTHQYWDMVFMFILIIVIPFAFSRKKESKREIFNMFFYTGLLATLMLRVVIPFGFVFVEVCFRHH